MKSSIEAIEKNHYHNLKQWLIKTNPFAEKLYSRAGTSIRPVTCSEYTAEMQIGVLKIDTRTMIEPVLDIGCGRQGTLVRYLCKLGIEAKGVDRCMFSGDQLVSADWLEFDYGTVKWGTIVSPLGFSNHFTHHHLREDGNFIGYTKKYMEILNSLKVGGSFHYSPHLPFVELYVNDKQYQIETHEIGEFNFRTTKIKRLR